MIAAEGEAQGSIHGASTNFEAENCLQPRPRHRSG